MGTISDFLENELLDHAIAGPAYTPPATVYLGLSLAFSVRNGSYQWTLSGSGTSEYYLEASGGGDPGLGGDPGTVIEDDADMTAGTLGSLATGEWAYGDNDTLGFNTIYVRLSDSTDPDSKAADYVLAGGNPFDDASGLTEPGDTYARQAITFGAAASRRVTQSGAETFPQATATWGWATHWALFDASSGGNMMAQGQLSSSKEIVSGNTPSVADTEVYIEFSAGEVSDYLANALLDFAFRNQAFTQPSTYVALVTATVGDSDTGSTIAEPGDTYARVQVNRNGGASPTWDLAASSLVDNTHLIQFATPTASWGTIVGVAIVDAAAAGNLLLYDNDLADQAVGTDDDVNFPAGDLDITLD